MKHRPLRSALALLLAAAMTLPAAFAAPAVSSSPAGEQVWQSQTQLTDGLTYTNTVYQNSSYGRESLYSLTLSPDSEVFPIVVPGDGTIYGGANISSAIMYARSLGYQVLGGINADFFSTSTRVPIGIVVEDGVYKSSPEGEPAILFFADGSAQISQPEVTLTLTNQGGSTLASNAGQTVALTHFNKSRNSAGLYLFSEDFSTVSTRTSTAGWMVRMKVVEGEELTLTSGLTLEVTEVFQTDGDTVPHAQAIGEDNFILTAASTAGLDGEFAKFAVGDRVTLSAQCSDELTAQAVWACGGGDILVQDGALTDTSTWDSAISATRNPRTLLGIHADGTLQLTVVDGRRSSHSNGLSLRTCAEELLAQGCVTVINLDGGGSSAMSVNTPGDDLCHVVNQPSDGTLRTCSTFILLVTPAAEAAGTPWQLHLAENGAVVLQGASIDLSQVYAADALAYYTETPEDVVLSVEGTCGTLEGTVYTAVSPGVETVTLTSPSTGAAGTAQIYVVDTLDTLTVTQEGSDDAVTSLSPNTGESIQLHVSGTWNGFSVTLEDTQAAWSVTGQIGAVTPEGLFTASHFSDADGTVEVACGGQTVSIPVSLPIAFLDVEDNWAKSFILTLAGQGIVGGVNTDAGTMYYPNQNITRQEFFIMLSNILGVDPAAYAEVELPFADADQIPSWSVNYIKAMYALGYTGGSLGADGLLYSNYSAAITRQEIAVLLGQFLPAPESWPLEFTDADQIPSWALSGMTTAVCYGLLGGYPDGSIQSGNSATRAEVAVILCNFQPLLEQAQAGTLTPPTPEGEEEETPSEGDPSGTQTGESGSAPDNETGTESPAEDPADSDTAGDDPSEQGPADSGTAGTESDSQTS